MKSIRNTNWNQANGGLADTRCRLNTRTKVNVDEHSLYCSVLYCYGLYRIAEYWIGLDSRMERLIDRLMGGWGYCLVDR